jgi:hypothetical protein
METAHFLRARAQLCLQMARLMSDSENAANLRADAARYLARALVLERDPDRNSPDYLND